MNKILHVIYVPGLGDTNPKGQQRIVKSWLRWGVEPEFFQMNWADARPWQEKFDSLLAQIDKATSEGKNVGLVGVSAGAGAAINAYAARKDVVVGCVLIAGKVNRPSSIGDGYKRKNPAFVDSARQAPVSLAKLNDKHLQHILSRYAVADETVYKLDSRIPGAHNRLVPSIGHFFTIASQITLGAPSFIRFLKRQAESLNT